MKITAKIPEMYHAPPDPNDIGTLVEGKGIYLGTYTLRDGNGNLGKVFNAYAAPVDLTGDDFVGLSLAAALNKVGKLKNFHGHDGRRYGHDVVLHDAMDRGDYKGEWVIPPYVLLRGHQFLDGEIVHHEHMHANRETGALKGTFATARSWYMSCTDRQDAPEPDYFQGADFASDEQFFFVDDKDLMRCRLVRFEPVAPKVEP